MPVKLGFYGAVRNAQRSNWAGILADAWAKRSAVEVVLDGWELGRALLNQLPERRVILRESYDEKASDAHPDGRGWVRYMRTQGYSAGLFRELENEPSVPPPDAVGRGEWLTWHAGWLLDTMDEAERLDVKLCIGNWSVLVPDPGDWRLYYREVLRRIAQGPHIIGWHVYYIKTPEHPMTQAAMANVDAALQIEPGLFGKGVLTETGKDHIWQVPDSPSGWVDNESQELHAARMIDLAEQWRNRGLYGAAEFIWQERFDEDNPTHRQWKNHNMAFAKTYNRLIAEHDFGEWLTMPLDLNNLVSGTIEPEVQDAVINIRNAPAGEFLGAMAGKNPCQRTAETVSKKMGSTAYTWRWYTFEDPDLVDGYMADEVLRWTAEIIPVPEPEPEPEPEPTPEPQPSPGTLTQQQALALMNSFIAMGDQLVAAIKQWQGLCIETRDEIAKNLAIGPKAERETTHEELAVR